MTGAIVSVTIVLIVIGGITAIVLSHFRLQRHRADAAAMASYRKLAEEAVSQQRQLQAELAALKGRVSSIDDMLRRIE
ncbi:hypothetical protein SSP35_05_04220 [Streptomyces sp. NBRC 110611]|uniref:hypothetical protein n=1 Tax=Streptomyces sp. NBRC 110611 TaxID=1621259 RepID=UPI00082A722F|nr:hypothetical protein [Streptomyces sp. NBRC 110611]GAU67855.1 hypothetical protein SSP35_05_04220 [Streptomyces sp. NBRC 110611]